MTPEELLDRVTDLQSFLAFVEALAAERREAERMEREQSTRYQLGGALNWQNCEISSFLEAAARHFEDSPDQDPEEAPTWKMFAEFLYCGKVIE
jgi:hypothetical protein